ncbi:MAG: 50S ribosomal protein L6 [Sandaracinaceae bacterium]|nr:50S ribosomal protein L6 [Sandaracinaceae bacterium]
MTQTEEIKNSRNGKKPIALDGVQVTIDGQTVKVKGPKGENSFTAPEEVKVEQRDGALVVSPAEGSGQRGTQFQGTTRAVLNNIVEGVRNGYQRSLDFRGVGYRAEFKDGMLKMTVGMSHQPLVKIPEGVKVNIETVDEAGLKFPRVALESVDKELVGRIAAYIRSLRPPETYTGKGVRYTGERIRQKAGKSGKK